MCCGSIDPNEGIFDSEFAGATAIEVEGFEPERWPLRRADGTGGWRIRGWFTTIDITVEPVSPTQRLTDAQVESVFREISEFPLPLNSAAIEELFVGGLTRILEFRPRWLQDGFVTLADGAPRTLGRFASESTTPFVILAYGAQPSERCGDCRRMWNESLATMVATDEDRRGSTVWVVGGGVRMAFLDEPDADHQPELADRLFETLVSSKPPGVGLLRFTDEAGATLSGRSLVDPDLYVRPSFLVLTPVGNEFRLVQVVMGGKVEQVREAQENALTLSSWTPGQSLGPLFDLEQLLPMTSPVLR